MPASGSATSWGDVHHRETQKWLQHGTLAVGRFSGPSILLIEIAGAVARRSGRSETALRLVTRLSSAAALRLYPFDETRRAEYIRLAADLRMRTPDVLYVALAQALGMPLVTWDRQQRERAGRVIDVFTPAEALARGI